MTPRNGSGEWEGSGESGSGTAVTSGDGMHEWWTLVAVCVGTFMLLLDVTIVNVALPKIQARLGSSFTDLQWVVDAYALTLAALLLTSGSLADLLGRRRIFAIGLLIFSAASLRGRAVAADAEPLAWGTGDRWRDDVRGLACVAGWRLSWTRPRGRVRCLGRRDRCGGVDRTGCRRGAHRRAELALDLPGQRPDRRRRVRADGVEGRRVAHQAIAHVPPQARGIVGEVARASFVAGLNEILLVASVLALAGAVAALLLIRSSDFVVQTEGQPEVRPAEAPEPARA